MLMNLKRLNPHDIRLKEETGFLKENKLLLYTA